MAKRYVLRDLVKIIPGQTYDDFEKNGKWRTHPIPESERLYAKVGGGTTADISEAEIIGWVSINKKWKRYIDDGRMEALEVKISLA